jgi:ribosomal protein L30/L7E
MKQSDVLKLLGIVLVNSGTDFTNLFGLRKINVLDETKFNAEFLGVSC